MPPAKRPDSLALHRLHVARARQFVRAHFADELDLGAIARAAGASMFHFSRLYGALTRETVFEYRTRLRLQAAARRLCDAPNASVSAIALEVGYETPSSFNKAFRRALGVSPSELRAMSSDHRRVALAGLAARSAPDPAPRSLRLARAPRIVRRRAVGFLYVRELGPYTEVAPIAWTKLASRLAAARMDLREHEQIGASYDDPLAVREEHLRYDAGVAVAPGVAPPPGTLAARLEGGDYAVFEYRGPYRYIAEAFRRIFRGWVCASGARLRSAPCLELYRNDPAEIAERDLLTELLIPVEASS